MIPEDAIDRAFEHMDTLEKVHKGENIDEQLEALYTFEEYLGLDEAARQRVREICNEHYGVFSAIVLRGFLIGLAASHYAAESV